MITFLFECKNKYFLIKYLIKFLNKMHACDLKSLLSNLLPLISSVHSIILNFDLCV